LSNAIVTERLYTRRLAAVASVIVLNII